MLLQSLPELGLLSYKCSLSLRAWDPIEMLLDICPCFQDLHHIVTNFPNVRELRIVLC